MSFGRFPGASRSARQIGGFARFCYLCRMEQLPVKGALHGRWLVIGAAALWSLSGLFAKAPFLERWPLQERAVLLAFWRALFAGLALLPFVPRPVWTWRLVPAAVCFALMNASFLLAMTFTTAANAIWLQYTAPAWVFLVGTLVLREPARRGDPGMVGLGMLGVAVILGGEWSFGASGGGAGDRVGVLWGLVSGISFAGVMLSLRQLRDLPGFWVVSVCHLSAAFFMLPWLFRQPSVWPGGPSLLWFAFFGIVQMALPYVLFTRGLRSLTGHEASCLTLLEPILVPAWVYLIWRHAPGYAPPAWWTFAGAALILCGLALRYWPRRGSGSRVGG